ncbi:DedA family protein [Croceicoccus marinus]|uniref:VTT domain-containing protein n=1 Tax=Croceicoccus marinus TaxID=450378 RepID=A0A1Z1FAE6_9SPHN|nr:DedA family protein [Croceicoccus marinus]ARU15771.1 hypothetical protein A9D14_05725 [Croceicoccus marinus]
MDELISRALQYIAANSFWAGPVVGLLAFGESLAFVGVLIPGTALLLGVGGLVGAGVLDPLWIASWLFFGAITGNWASYVIGRKIGPQVYRRWPLNRNRRAVARARLFFRRYGFAAVFLSRFLGPLRAVLPVVAGVMEMSARRFQAANLLSGGLWVPAILGPGYLAADALPEGGITQMHVLLFAVGVLAITGAGTWIGARLMRGRR